MENTQTAHTLVHSHFLLLVLSLHRLMCMEFQIPVKVRHNGFGT